jgi:hypothetical protein
VRSGASALWDTVSTGLSQGWDWVKRKADELETAVEGRQRGLTADERAYARDVFGDAIDYDQIIVARGGLATTGASRTLGNLIALQDGYFVGDTLDLTAAGRETLVHEMTHAYQYQTGGWGYAPEALWAQLKSFVTTGDRGGAYDWKPQDAAGVPWEQWNPEQQAQCVEDYNVLLRKQQAHQPLTPEEMSILGRAHKYIDAMQAGPPRTPAGAGAP